MQPPIVYLAGGQLGDFIHSLSVVKENYIKTGRKGLVCMTDNAGWIYTFFNRGVQATHLDILPLIRQQPYIEDLRIHTDESIDCNLSLWRTNFSIYEGWQDIYGRNYNVEWSKTPWLSSDIDEQYSNTVFISTTPRRWWDEPFDMVKLISKLGPDVRFLASEISNYEHFCEQTGIKPPVVIVSSFTEVVQVIASCKLLVGTLSAHVSIADALHKKRISLQTGADHEIASRTNPSFLTPQSNLDTLEMIT